MSNKCVVPINTNSSLFPQYKIYIYYFYIFFLMNFITPEVIHDSKIYEMLYSQKNYFSNHFDFSKFSIFMFTFIFGYFLSINKFHSNNIICNQDTKNKQSLVIKFLIFIMICIIFFFTSGITVLLGKYDYEIFCDSIGKENLKLFQSKIKKYITAY